MHEAAAVFYGAYDQVHLHQLPPLHIPWTVWSIGVAGLVLTGFVAADVATYANPPVVIHVTDVTWYVMGGLLASSAGFSVRTSQSFSLSFECLGLCYRLDGAAVGAPFQLVGVAITNQPVQYANLTVRAPATAYSGVLNVTLEVG